MRYGSGVAGRPALHVKTRQVTVGQLQSLVDLSGYQMTAMRYVTASGGIPNVVPPGGNFSAPWVSARPLENTRAATPAWLARPEFRPIISQITTGYQGCTEENYTAFRSLLIRKSRKSMTRPAMSKKSIPGHPI